MRQRVWFILGFIACLSLILVALYMEHVMKLQACPLCVFQRVAFIAVGIICLLAAFHNPGVFGRKVYSALVLVSAGIGAIIAGRHVWLQNLPKDQVPDCGPGLSYIFDVFPLFDALSFIFEGSGECAEVSWSFLGLTIPGWSLLLFIAIIVISVMMLMGKLVKE